MTEPGLKTFVQGQYRGLYSLRRSTEIPHSFAAHVLNIDLSSSSQIAPLKGHSRFGHQPNAADKVNRMFTYERGNGYKTIVQVRDNGTNTLLEALIRGDNRNSQDGQWMILEEGFTTGKVMSFAPFNDTGVDNLLMSNGTDIFTAWNGAICLADGAISAGGATITVSKTTDDPKTNPTDGFGATGTLVYRDTAGVRVEVTYTGKTGTTFTGCAGATASADNTGIAQIPDITTYSGVPKFSYIITAQGRVWGTGVVGSETVMQGSEVSDFTNYTVSTTPSSPLTEDFPEGGKNVALAAIDNWIIIFKERQVIAFGLEFPSSSTRAAVRKHVADIGIASSKAITRVGNDYWFISNVGQLRRLQRLEAENIFQTEDLGSIIRPTIKNFDYSDAALGYWTKERIMVAACRTDEDQSINEKIVYIQFSENIEGAAIINHGVMDWAVSDWTEYDGDFYFGGSASSRCYKAFDGYTKDGAAIVAEYTTKAEHFGEEFEQKEIVYLAVKGRIGAGTTLYVEVLFDENGKTAVYEYDLADTDTEYITQGVSNPLGVNALGTEPLGGTVDDVDELDPFFVVFEIPRQANPYTVQATFSSDGEGQRWVVDAHAWYHAPTSNSVFPLKGVT